MKTFLTTFVTPCVYRGLAITSEEGARADVYEKVLDSSSFSLSSSKPLLGASTPRAIDKGPIGLADWTRVLC